MLDKYYYGEQVEVEKVDERIDDKVKVDKEEPVQQTTIDYYSGQNNNMKFILIGFIIAIILVFVTFVKIEQREPLQTPTCYEVGRFAYNPDNYYNQKGLPICD